MQDETLDALVVNTLKTLAMDAVQKASSGHPGMPMGMADASSVLWREFLCLDPSDPGFSDRDRFVLSAGHGSMLLYGLLHVSGFNLPLEEIKRFRQLGSLTPGHPEVGLTAGVETTTGPLGQGFANGVGMALAERHLAAHFNRPGFELVNHFTYAICSDGDLMEGLSQEAASLAGHLGLGKLIYLYDDNSITIDGATDIAFTEDTTGRFQACGWQVLAIDGHDHAAVRAALKAAQDETNKPSLIRCKTHIGHGSPNKQDCSSSHGAPLGEDEVRLTKQQIGWTAESTFHVPAQARAAFGGLRERGAAKNAAWKLRFAGYRDAHPKLAARWELLHQAGGLPEGLAGLLPSYEDGDEEATRASSGRVINALAEALPTMLGGSADLAGSNKTDIKGAAAIQKDQIAGRNIHYGVREHAMGAIMNGMALHGGVIPFGGTFLTFSDYMRPAIRLAALMSQRVIYVFSHDSIFLGEDGPTHQAVEHAAALRQIPGLDVLRPADGRETAAAWLTALERSDGPSALLLTRQGVPVLPGTSACLEGVARGGYVVYQSQTGSPRLLLMGTGSELHLCTEAAVALEQAGFPVRVVSMPCLDRFERQSEAYREEVLPSSCPVRVSVEAGRTEGWLRLVGPYGASIGVDSFGESAPAEDLAKHFKLTVEHVVSVSRSIIDGFGPKASREIDRLNGLLDEYSRADTR